jgi:hypothetical protein
MLKRWLVLLTSPIWAPVAVVGLVVMHLLLFFIAWPLVWLFTGKDVYEELDI